ncbi:hypothetical protein FB45DRAFT_1054052 [Roridomyces roridus]|uniref:F-box domain-containing protein n=1 Tax=Roridomyces roridus TaxID=1738132 RepID=A0AAD7C9R1_9AGAR|nr:hypothetical protein FB45DRAFT_1054052 [Roridomyces roridus]
MSVQALEAQISAVSKDVERQKEVLKKLERSRSLLQRQLNDIRDPITRLPLEISSEIFLRCLCLDRASPEYRRTGIDDIPIILLQICHAWTEIALSTTALWSTLHIVLLRSLGFSPVFERWLERARNQPLELRVTINAEAADDDEGLGAFEDDITALIQARFGRLKSLDIELGGQYSSTLGIHFGVTEMFPLLRTLKICGLSRLECPSSSLIELLRHSPNLVELSIQDMNLLPNATGALVFQHLRRLDLVLNPWNPESDDHILACITAPGLESLELGNMHMVLAQLVPFLERSSPPLQKLSIDFLQMKLGGWPVDSELLVGILDICPTATQLEISCPYSDAIAQLSAILARSDSSKILPNLQILEFLMPQGTFPDSYWDMLLPVILARRTTLRTLRIRSYVWNPKSVLLDSFVSPVVLPALKELEAGGMSVWIGKDKNLFPS